MGWECIQQSKFPCRGRRDQRTYIWSQITRIPSIAVRRNLACWPSGCDSTRNILRKRNGWNQLAEINTNHLSVLISQTYSRRTIRPIIDPSLLDSGWPFSQLRGSRLGSNPIQQQIRRWESVRSNYFLQICFLREQGRWGNRDATAQCLRARSWWMRMLFEALQGSYSKNILKLPARRSSSHGRITGHTTILSFPSTGLRFGFTLFLGWLFHIFLRHSWHLKSRPCLACSSNIVKMIEWFWDNGGREYPRHSIDYFVVPKDPKSERFNASIGWESGKEQKEQCHGTLVGPCEGREHVPYKLFLAI